MDSLHCTQCGEKQPAGARFCPRCGNANIIGAAVDPMIGKVVSDRYLLTDKLGQGASGTIYRAEHTTLHRKMAIKILHHELSKDDAAVERFRREATTVGQIDNDHILQVLDFGRTEDQRLYFAMELLEGETLQSLLSREQRLDPDRAVRLLIQIGEALGEAHALGYIHRDLRPRNVFLSVRRGERDFVKLLDFGLAKLIRPDVDTKQTALGMNFGDPSYMSPEQGRGDVIDRRSDVFSLGVVAFELVTGVTPFRGSGPFDILQKVIGAPAPLVTTLRADCPAWLEAVIAKALQKRPDDRFSTMLRMIECLRGEVAPARAPDAPVQVNDLEDTMRTVLSPPPATAPLVAAPVAVAPVAAPVVTPSNGGAPLGSRTLIMPTALPASLSATPTVVVAPEPITPHRPERSERPAAREKTIPAETASGELRTVRRSSEMPVTPTASIVVEDGMREPTGPQRAVGDDGWFSDRPPAAIEEDFEEEAKKKKRKAAILIGGITGAISLAAFGAIALWPHAPQAPKHVEEAVAVQPATASPPVVPTTPVPVAPVAPTAPEPPAPKAVEPVAVAPAPKPLVAPPVAEVAPSPPPEKSEKHAPHLVPPPTSPALVPPPSKTASSEPSKSHTERTASAKSTHDTGMPKNFKDPFAPNAMSAGQVDVFIKSGRQKLAAGDLPQAQGAFNKARELDSHNADAYAGLGEVSFELGDYNGATVQLKQALRISPNRARFLVLLGQSYYKLGRAKEAAVEYKRALRVDPSNQEAQRSLELAEKKIAQGG